MNLQDLSKRKILAQIHPPNIGVINNMCRVVTFGLGDDTDHVYNNTPAHIIFVDQSIKPDIRKAVSNYSRV